MNNPNRPKLPPLHDLTAFEAAARHMSFLKASDELHVTQSAISHRIRSLEDFLGVALFIRVNRNIALTSFGERYLADVREVLDRLGSATARLAGDNRVRLRVSAAPALGARWLVSRLALFERAHPHIELVVSSSYDLDLLRRGEADVGIRYGSEPEKGLQSIRLFEETLFPVASPGYIASIGGLASPRDLNRAQLLRHPLLSWKRWFAAAGIERDEPGFGILFEDATLMYEAAAAGQGVALGLKTLFEDAEQARLVKPFELEAWDSAYNIVLSPAARQKPEVATFCEWLREAAEGPSPAVAPN
jgi:LysR family transcriptional regulator, glycine cleavage system transcriptional activator